MKSLNEKVAYITGGSKGIGYGIARSLLENGCKVAITSRSQEGADKAGQMLSDVSGNIFCLSSDVRSLESEQSAVSKVLNKWGRLDIVIANAGLGHFASITEMSSGQWQETIDVNLTGVFNTMKASIPALEKSHGYLFTIASLAGANFFAGGAAYNASKFGLVGMTQAVMLDLRQKGIKVTTIMPGSVATYFNNHVPDEKDNWKIQIEDLGQMVVDLLNLPPRTLPSKIEVRPSMPPVK